MTAPVSSPCVNVCRMDEATGWCAGCLRTLDEIAAWARLPDAGRRAVWAQLPLRRAAWLQAGRGELPPAPAAPAAQESPR